MSDGSHDFSSFNMDNIQIRSMDKTRHNGHIITNLTSPKTLIKKPKIKLLKNKFLKTILKIKIIHKILKR